MNFSVMIDGFKTFLHGFAEVAAAVLELVGILIILLGTFKALYRLIRHVREAKPFNVVIDLGRSLALALECKMGAEIIHTVIVRDLKELGILAVVILIRALLSVIIHWEIRMEQNAEQKAQANNAKNESKDE